MKTLVRAAVAMLLTFLLSAPLVAQQPTAPNSKFLPQAQNQNKEKNERREHHPHIRGAIRELQEAKNELQHADHDFNGHRADALKACDEAIQQLRLALQNDKK